MATDRTFRTDLSQWLTGFFSAFLAVAIVPRIVGIFVRRFTGKLVLEALAFTAMGFLFERGAKLAARPRARKKPARV